MLTGSCGREANDFEGKGGPSKRVRVSKRVLIVDCPGIRRARYTVWLARSFIASLERRVRTVLDVRTEQSK